MKFYYPIFLFFILLQGCAGVNTFPTMARAGDTVSLMVGGSEDARKDAISITLIDFNDNEWDLQALGLVRTVFSVRPDGLSEGLNYSSYLDLALPWLFGHEAIQTILVIDVPDGVAPGLASVNVSTNTTDNSAGIGTNYIINLEIIAGTGSTDNFLFKHPIEGDASTDFSRLEPLPYGKISFLPDTIIGAASFVVDFDETIVNSDSLTLYVPQSTVRNPDTGNLDKVQRMVNWRQDGQQFFIDIVAPQGINSVYLNMYILHPRGLSGVPDFNLLSAQIYDINGNLISLSPVFEYIP